MSPEFIHYVFTRSGLSATVKPLETRNKEPLFVATGYDENGEGFVQAWQPTQEAALSQLYWKSAPKLALAMLAENEELHKRIQAMEKTTS